MKKLLCVLWYLIVIFTISGCLTFGSSGRMLDTVNALGYSDDQTNIDYAKKIWNGPINVLSEIQDVGYLASCDIDNINSLIIYIPYDLKDDAEYNVEIATILSYFAEIYRQVQAKETISIDKAISHMKNSYNLMIDNYLVGNKIEPKNPRKFKEFVDNLEKCDVSGSIHYFGGA
ncbi:MAG: hypothetical protein LBP20_02080, partial [Treponema sp.]|nr:hypothetical protein [Treponema sp.]